MLRYGDCKLHMIAGQMGGIASQEAVKLLTKQFVPINNTLVLNGLTGEAAVYQI
jgi:amyloid beta precursor protein binding protein 1